MLVAYVAHDELAGIELRRFRMAFHGGVLRRAAVRVGVVLCGGPAGGQQGEGEGNRA